MYNTPLVELDLSGETPIGKFYPEGEDSDDEFEKARQEQGLKLSGGGLHAISASLNSLQGPCPRIPPGELNLIHVDSAIAFLCQTRGSKSSPNP